LATFRKTLLYINSEEERINIKRRWLTMARHTKKHYMVNPATKETFRAWTRRNGEYHELYKAVYVGENDKGKELYLYFNMFDIDMDDNVRKAYYLATGKKDDGKRVYDDEYTRLQMMTAIKMLRR
jgi:hypothetical protein